MKIEALAPHGLRHFREITRPCSAKMTHVQIFPVEHWPTVLWKWGSDLKISCNLMTLKNF